MALIKQNAADTTNANADVVFENGDETPFDNETSGTEAAAEPTALERAQAQAAERAAAVKAAEKAAAAEAEEAAPAKTTALAKGTNNAPAISFAKANPFPQMENVLPIEFNTFPQVKADQGKFVYADSDTAIGEEIEGELVTWQYQWMLAPGDVTNAKSKEWLRYSNDGVTTQDGEDINDILRQAKAGGFPNAKIQKRILFAINVTKCDKLPGIVGKFVQFDLSPNSVKNFSRHQFSTAFAIQKGTIAQGVNPAALKLKAVPKKVDKTSWTEIDFEQA